MIHVEHGPLKRSYASVAALDCTEDTSLPLNPQLHHLLLTELGITDIQASKAALSDPLTYDQVLMDPDIEQWKKRTHKEITQLESKDTWVEVPTSEATSKILPGTWYCIARELLQESSPSSREHIVSEVTYKKKYQKPMHQLFHGAQSGLYLSTPLPKNGISSVWTSTMPLSKLTSRTQCGYIFPEDTNPNQSHLHVSD